MHYTQVPYLGVTCPEPRHNQLAVFLRIPFIALNLTHEGLSFLQDFFFKILMWTILNLSWISYNIACFLKNLRFWFFGCEAHGILAPQPGIEPTPSALEGEVLNTGPPGKSHERSPLLKEISSPS